MVSRRYLFLQGHATPFYLRLGKTLVEHGHSVSRINVSGGDRLFWGNWRARDFQGQPNELGAFVGSAMDEDNISDLIIYNDCRPCNATAVVEAKRRGLRIHVFEEGYLRPNWITLERDGVNGNSRLPADPDWFLDLAARLPPFEPGQAVGSGMRQRILFDFAWQFANYRYKARYPHYRTHRPYPIWAEYFTWSLRLFSLQWRMFETNKLVRSIIEGTRRFYLLPMQLDSDSQIRVHSRFGLMTTALEFVITDFAAHAPADTALVIKNHPLDNNWVRFRHIVTRMAREKGIDDRIIFIDGGNLNQLIDRSVGIITVNSTVGLTSLGRHKPVICLGKAIFDLPGLTFQGTLTEFWRAAAPPEPHLLAAFLTVIQHACLVNGNFYTEQGMALGITNSLPRLCDDGDQFGPPSQLS